MFSLMNSVSSQNDTQCVENPTGEVSLNVAVRGVPGPHGPQGPKGMIGPRGNIGVKGGRGEQGEKGERGDTGSSGPKGVKGVIGSKGHKGVRGIQGIPGPVGGPGLEGPVGPRGHPGPDGVRGPQGRAGLPGPRGSQGEPGDTVLTKQEFTRVTSNVHTTVLSDLNTTLISFIDDMHNQMNSLSDTVMQKIQSGDEDVLTTVMKKFDSLDDKLTNLKLNVANVKCGIYGPWREIASFDTTRGDSCPSGLKTVTGTHQRACGNTDSSDCTSLQFPSGGSYTNVCGRARGYQYYHTDGFRSAPGRSLDEAYVDGISFTQGSPRRHLWTYAAGENEQDEATDPCPCATTRTDVRAKVPSYVGNHFYCESGFVDKDEKLVAWNDPLWDGFGCSKSRNQCCQRYGWFHRTVSLSSDSIEIRWCDSSSSEDVLTDQLEVWVM
jgi:dynein heavy chain